MWCHQQAPEEEEVRLKQEVTRIEEERIQVLNNMEELEQKIKELDNQMDESVQEVKRNESGRVIQWVSESWVSDLESQWIICLDY